MKLLLRYKTILSYYNIDQVPVDIFELQVIFLGIERIMYMVVRLF